MSSYKSIHGMQNLGLPWEDSENKASLKIISNIINRTEFYDRIAKQTSDPFQLVYAKNRYKQSDWGHAKERKAWIRNSPV